LADYNGVFRRFEYKGTKEGIIVYDYYAQHPTEIEATLKGLRDGTNHRIIAVFQPHLFSRTRDFYQEFGRSFFQSDALIVTPIYPARELPIPGITGKMIADAAINSGHQNVYYVENNSDIISQISAIAQEGDIVLTLGAGNIYRYGESFLQNKKDI
ncbi:MAG TPA: cyanophycin synthetase, partial [Candidatus Cloacimonadota bacterium]|nr:cyanophycin synthetase [Candidatus Cloacimonadota bacterium]